MNDLQAVNLAAPWARVLSWPPAMVQFNFNERTIKAKDGTLSAQDQQRIVQGLDDGPLGQASRRFREMGGFVRFAPLPGGTLETRVFRPAN